MPLEPGPTSQISAQRLRALIVILYRTGMRISEALALTEHDLDPQQHAILIRRGKGGKRRVVLIDDWGWNELERWLVIRARLPVGPLLCVVRGRNVGSSVSASDVRRQFHQLQERADLRRRFAPHQLRHTFSVEFHRESKDLLALQRQLGHANPSITAVYLRGLDDLEVLAPIRSRKPPMTPIP